MNSSIRFFYHQKYVGLCGFILPQTPPFRYEMHKNRWRLRLCPRPRWGSLQSSPDSLAGFRERVGRGRVGEGRRGEGREQKSVQALLLYTLSTVPHSNQKLLSLDPIHHGLIPKLLWLNGSEIERSWRCWKSLFDRNKFRAQCNTVRSIISKAKSDFFTKGKRRQMLRRHSTIQKSLHATASKIQREDFRH